MQGNDGGEQKDKNIKVNGKNDKKGKNAKGKPKKDGCGVQ